VRLIYLDHIAATQPRPEVVEAMLPFLRERFANAQSLHSGGQEAMQAVEEARGRVAGLIGASADEVYFTASGSESNNFALKGMALAGRSRGKRIVLSAVEHLSVLNAAKSLEKLGFETVIVPVDGLGRVDPGDVRKALTKDTVLVSVQTANSEVGTMEPVAEIARISREHGVLFHTDAVAAVGNVPVDVRALGADALSLAADQFYGPKGAAALYIRKGTRIVPLIDGGVQESGRRGGTENVPAIVGMGRAAEIAAAEMSRRIEGATLLRDRLTRGLIERVDRSVLTGDPSNRLPHHASFCVEFIEGEAMLLHLDMKGVAASSGSACTSKSLKVSHVLLAMGLDHALAQGSLVFSLLETTSAADIDRVLEVFPPIVDNLRRMSPLYTKFLEEKTS
jgi:cysteine desulfurase